MYATYKGIIYNVRQFFQNLLDSPFHREREQEGWPANDIKSFWATLKRGQQGYLSQDSEKHLGRYVTGFAGRHNIRDLDTLDPEISVLAKVLIQ